MKNIINLFLISISFLLLSGCTIQKQVVGEFYLQQKQYDKGYAHFRQSAKTDNTDALAQYYYGRFLLAKDKKKEALLQFKKAVELDGTNADYYCWLGVAYSSLKQHNNERKAYIKALGIDKNHLQSLTYLAHNLYENKEYEKAFKYYSKVLKISPQSQTALFNRSMSLNKLGRKPEEKIAWNEYLAYYPAGSLARSAVENLNSLGGFDYKNYIIGLRTITLKKITFKPFSSNINYDSKSSLDFLGGILNRNKKIKIQITAYQQKNALLAKQRAKSIKNYILNKYPKVDSSRLRLSWTDKPKNLIIDKKGYEIGEFIDFITIKK